MVAGIETLKVLKEGTAYKRLETVGAALETGLSDAARRVGTSRPATASGSRRNPARDQGR